MTNYFVRQGDLKENDVFVADNGQILTVVEPYKNGMMSVVQGAVPNVRMLDHFTSKTVEVQTIADEFEVLVLHKRVPTNKGY